MEPERQKDKKAEEGNKIAQEAELRRSLQEIERDDLRMIGQIGQLKGDPKGSGWLDRSISRRPISSIEKS
jgi:hypothetical protein